LSGCPQSEVIPSHAISHPFRESAHIGFYLTATNLACDFSKPGFTHLSQISFNYNGANKDHQKGRESQPKMNLQSGYHPNQADDTNYDSPLDITERMAIERRLADFASKLRIRVIKLLLYLMKDALFVVRERHEIFRSSVLPV
jgi:hypothetical protein